MDSVALQRALYCNALLLRCFRSLGYAFASYGSFFHFLQIHFTIYFYVTIHNFFWNNLNFTNVLTFQYYKIKERCGKLSKTIWSDISTLELFPVISHSREINLKLFNALNVIILTSICCNFEQIPPIVQLFQLLTLNE